MLVEDNATYRHALAEALARHPDIQAVAPFPSLERALAALQAGEIPDVMLLDLKLPGRSGLDAIPDLARAYPDMPILVLTQYDDKQTVFRAIDQGAAGYLLKTASVNSIAEGLVAARDGGAPLDPAITKMFISMYADLQPDTASELLTPRETEILRMLSTGQAKKQVAARLGISFHTVNMHTRNIYEKLNVHNLAAALRAAIELRLL